LPITHERGYLIPAFGAVYEQCAERLKQSIIQHNPNAHITVITSDMLPYGDQGGYANDWQCHWLSPYRQTIKLEADMICASPIDHWWTMLEHKDVVVSTGARDFYNNVTNNRYYRKAFDANNLPDVYNAITYWRVSKLATEFFQLVRDIFTRWDQYRTLIKFPDDVPSTDLVYAMASEIIGREQVTLPDTTYPRIVHMKSKINPIRGEDWTKELVWEHDPFRIQTVAQWGMVHYYVKDWQ
jgi:hypothetical protein